MSILTKTGEPIRLNYQLNDGVVLMPIVVKAYLKDAIGNYLSGYEDGITLTHVGIGQFKNFTVMMPDTPEVTATYIPYDEDGVTESIDYTYALDIYTNSDSLGGSGEGIDTSDILKLANSFADSIVVSVAEDDNAPIEVIVVDEEVI